MLPPQFVKPTPRQHRESARWHGRIQRTADSAALRDALPAIVVAKMVRRAARGPSAPRSATTSPLSRDRLAGGACAGTGLLLDIHDPAHPVRIDAVADSNFSFWHSATFNNDGTKMLFSDEWGGGGAA